MNTICTIFCMHITPDALWFQFQNNFCKAVCSIHKLIGVKHFPIYVKKAVPDQRLTYGQTAPLLLFFTIHFLIVFRICQTDDPCRQIELQRM